MNSLLLLPQEVVAAGRAVILGDRALKVQAVHELAPNASVKVGVLNGDRGSARVELLEPERIELSLSLTELPRDREAVEILVAVPRPQTVKKVLLTAAQFGIERVTFVKSHHTVKSYLQSHSLRREAIDEQLHKGLEQVWDTIAPTVRVFSGMREYYEYADSTAVAGAASLHLLAEPGAPSWPALPGGRLDAATAVTFAIGPEAGWTEGELDAFETRGFRRVSLGDRMFRVETALAALLGQIVFARSLGFCAAET